MNSIFRIARAFNQIQRHQIRSKIYFNMSDQPQKNEETQDQAQEGQEEKMSKSKLKQLQKKEKQDKLKAEKAAQQPPQVQKAEKVEVEKKQTEQEKEEDFDPSQYYENRCKIVQNLKQTKNPFPYPHKFHQQFTIPQFREIYEVKCSEKGSMAEETVQITGRVFSIRSAGPSLIFYDLQQDGAKLQVMVNAKLHDDPTITFERIHSLIRRGDIIGVRGKPTRTKAGELSIAPGSVQLLAPNLHQLPKAHYGFKDMEKRYRMRYLDLIVNNKVRDVFKTRSEIIKYVRNYLDQLNFVEVETPVLNMIPGGATARPFITHHNDLDMQLYMRVAPELYLKQCIVGGLDRVFEIGKNFRNEGIDQTHNPEFTGCEFYMAYADFHDLMNITEDMISKMVLKIKGSFKFNIHDQEGKEIELDFTPPWRRVPMLDELARILKVDIPQDLESEAANQFFQQLCKQHNVECKNPRTTARLIDKLVGQFIEVDCKNPTFIIEHPQLMSPLAKFHRSKPGLTERFELFINYHELCNAYTELNDPFIQKDLFLQQAKEKTKGDHEAMHYDEHFVKALEHGLPPTGGWGLGIDRMVMLLTDNVNIQEVLLFPAMKPEQKEPTEAEKKEQLEKQGEEVKK